MLTKVFMVMVALYEGATVLQDHVANGVVVGRPMCHVPMNAHAEETALLLQQLVRPLLH
jgi:hypothetical protein